jgi:hypothetical protein
MVTDIVQTAVCAFDGAEFSQLAQCPYCGGPVHGYDTREKKFAVLQEAGQERTITVKVRRFQCRLCKKIGYAEEPFYPETRLGSVIIDLYMALSATMPHSRAARIMDAMGIRVDRTTWRNYHNRTFREVAIADVFGMRLPLYLLSLSTLAARTPEGERIDGAEALAACGFPSTFREAPNNMNAPNNPDEKNIQMQEKIKNVLS